VETASSKHPTFGIASVVFGVLTIAVPFLVFLFFASSDEIKNGKTGWEGLALVLVTVILGGIGAAVAAAGGVITGIVGLVRGERKKWLAVVGLIFSGGLLTMLLWVYVTARN
jgi:hypothetical protein